MDNGWDEWGRHVLTELKRIGCAVEKQSEEHSELKVELARLQVKSGVWGALAGIVVVLSVLLMKGW